MNNIIKTPQEIEIMKRGGKIAAEILKKVLSRAKPGVTTGELDEFTEREVLKVGAKPSFKTVRNYKHTTCLTVNDQVVHGLPGDYALKAGDILGVDLGVLYKGYHTDTARTIVVGGGDEVSEKTRNFLKTGEFALSEAIKKARTGNYVGDLSHTIQTIVERAGFSVVRVLTGHGVGKKLHEPPQIPCFGSPGTGHKLEEGMTIAIEIIYNMGKPDVVFGNKNPWTIVTRDGSLSGLFEKTVAITKNGPIILT